MSSMYALPPASHVSKYFPPFFHVTNACRKKAPPAVGQIPLCVRPALLYTELMKKLFTLLKDSLSAFLDFFSTPPRRGQCPHCGGGKCYGACQFVRKDEDGQKK